MLFLMRHAGKSVVLPDTAIPLLESKFAAGVLGSALRNSTRCTVIQVQIPSDVAARVLTPIRSSCNVWIPDMDQIDRDKVYLQALQCEMDVDSVPCLLGLKDLQQIESSETRRLRASIEVRLEKNKRKRQQLKALRSELTVKVAGVRAMLADVSDDSGD